MSASRTARTSTRRGCCNGKRAKSPSGLAGSASSPHSGAPFCAGFARVKASPLVGRWPSVSKAGGAFAVPRSPKPKKACTHTGHTPFLCKFYWYCFTFSIRVAFSTASTMTPTSAKTPHHMFVMPSAVKIRHSALTASAKTMFW